MGGLKIQRPNRLENDTEINEADLYAWWNELINFLNQHEDIDLYKKGGYYAEWSPAEMVENRIEKKHKDDTGDLSTRQKQLHNIITIIAGCCARNQYMMILRQSTSLEWVWNELRIIYSHQHKGKEFLSIAEQEYKADKDTPLSFYNAYRARILENLLPA